MSSIKVSVIVPVYKVEAFLGKCLDSILAQTYPEIEIVLVDDGSPDGSGAICDAYAAKDSRVVVIHKQNEGVSKARLDGCRRSTGEYVTFVDADDYIAADYVEVLLQEALDGGFDMVGCQFVNVKGEQTKEDHRPVVGRYDREGIRRIIQNHFLFDPTIRKSGMNVYLWSKLYRRGIIFGALPFGVGLSFGEDMVIVVEVMRRISSMSLLDNHLYYYLQHSNQVTRSQVRGRWAKYVSCWRTLIRQDEEKLLESQMPDRIWFRIRELVLRVSGPSYSYQEFSSQLQEIYETKDIMAYLHGQSRHTKFQHFLLFILRYRMYFLAFCVLRIRRFITG